MENKSLDDFLSFAKNCTAFTPPPYMEAMLQVLQGKKNRKISVTPYGGYKSRINNEFTCAALQRLKKGECFILVSPDGMRRFRLEEVEKYE